MKRVIKSYEKMDSALRVLLQKAYPDGINADVILTFQDHTGKRFKGLELVNEDTIYLIKLDEMLRSAFADADDKDDTDDDFDDDEGPDGDKLDDSFEGVDD